MESLNLRQSGDPSSGADLPISPLIEGLVWFGAT